MLFENCPISGCFLQMCTCIFQICLVKTSQFSPTKRMALKITENGCRISDLHSKVSPKALLVWLDCWVRWFICLLYILTTKCAPQKNCILNQFFELLKNKLFPFCNCIRVCIQCNAIAFIRFGYISPLFPTHISRHLLMQMDNVFLSFYILLFMIIGKIWKMGLRKWAYIDYWG